MQTQTISVKQLRTEFPKIVKSLKKGTDYTLIYRSKPIAKIEPIRSSQEGLKMLLAARKSLSFKSKKSAVELVRGERD